MSTYTSGTQAYIYFEPKYVQKNPCTGVLIAAFFITTKNKKQHKRSATVKCINICDRIKQRTVT